MRWSTPTWPSIACRDARLLTEHLIDGMGAVDGSRDGQTLPRFVSVADNRDFFYLLRRTPR